MHGDHLFGLAGVLCMLGQASTDEREKARQAGEEMTPVDIYGTVPHSLSITYCCWWPHVGPEGIRDYLRSVISLTYSRIAAPHRIHEIKDVPYLHGQFTRRPPEDDHVHTRYSGQYGEVNGGRDIYPDKRVSDNPPGNHMK